MRWQQVPTLSDEDKQTFSYTTARPKQVSAEIDESDLFKSENSGYLLKNHPSLGKTNTCLETTMDDSNSSDLTLLRSDSSPTDVYDWQWELKKTNSLATPLDKVAEAANLVVSQQYDANEPKIAPKMTRLRAKSGPATKRKSSSTGKSSQRFRPNVWRYAQDFSEKFINKSVLLEEITDSSKIVYIKCEDSLDGLTYVLKKQNIQIGLNQDIHEHPIFKQIWEVRDNPLPLSIRYVNSWVEKFKSLRDVYDKPTNTLNVVLVIQMTYIGDHFKLAKDLTLLTLDSSTFDEDDIDEQVDCHLDTLKEGVSNGATEAEALSSVFNKIGLNKCINATSLENTVWQFCYKGLLASP